MSREPSVFALLLTSALGRCVSTGATGGVLEACNRKQSHIVRIFLQQFARLLTRALVAVLRLGQLAECWEPKIQSKYCLTCQCL